MAKRFFKSEVISSAVGAARTGITAITGVAGPTVQDAISQLKTLIDARLFGVRYEGGSPVTYQKYLNFKGNVNVTNNAGLEATDIEILEQDFRWMGVWSGSSVAYLQDDFVSRNGSMYRSKNGHTSSAGAPPESNTTNWELAVSAGAAGAGPGGTHGSTHTSGGVDPVPDATTSVSGLLSGADKTKLNGVATGAVADHGALTGLIDDDHTQYAKADGTRLLLATSVSSPGANQVRLNGLVAERWDSVATAWVPLQADANPATPLSVDTPDMAPDRSIIEHWSSLSHPTTAIEGQVIYESDTGEYLSNASATFGSPDFIPLVPSSGGGASPPYTQQVGSNATFVAWGDGDPGWAARMLNVGELVARPTSSELGAATVRLVRFRLPRTLVVATAKVFALATDSALRYRWGIYRVSDGVKVWDSTAQSVGSQNAWKSMSTGLPATLDAGVDYWLAWTSPSTNGTNHYWTLGAPRHENIYVGAGSPIANKNAGIGQLARVATTGGVLPDPLGSILAPDWNANQGSLPFVFLEGSAT